MGQWTLKILLPHMKSLNRPVRQLPGRNGQQFNTLQQVIGDDWQHGVELKVAGLSRHGDGRVIADHLGGDHRCSLWNHRIHLARHNAGTGL